MPVKEPNSVALKVFDGNQPLTPLPLQQSCSHHKLDFTLARAVGKFRLSNKQSSALVSFLQHVMLDLRQADCSTHSWP